MPHPFEAREVSAWVEPARADRAMRILADPRLSPTRIGSDDARTRRQQAVAQLDLGPDWNAALMRCLQHRMTAGHAGAPDDRLTPLVVDGVRGDDRHRRLASPLRRVVDERHLATGFE